MKKENSKAKWLKGVPSKFELPMAHGEGKFVPINSKLLNQLEKNGQVIFRYAANPNGSTKAIAGVCNAQGNVIGLMPHPERFVSKYQHPAWTRGAQPEKTPGFMFWQSALQYASQGKK